MHLKNTPCGQFVVPAKRAAATQAVLEGERERYEGDTDPSSPEYLAVIQRLIAAVREGQPIDLAAYMSQDEQRWAVESGQPGYGTVALYLLGTVEYQFADDKAVGSTAEGWRYLSDLAALAAGIEAAMLAPA